VRMCLRLANGLGYIVEFIEEHAAADELA